MVGISSERLLRDELDPHLECLSVPLPIEALASCNINSIAIATGFNRESTWGDKETTARVLDRGLPALRRSGRRWKVAM